MLKIKDISPLLNIDTKFPIRNCYGGKKEYQADKEQTVYYTDPMYSVLVQDHLWGPCLMMCQASLTKKDDESPSDLGWQTEGNYQYYIHNIETRGYKPGKILVPLQGSKFNRKFPGEDLESQNMYICAVKQVDIIRFQILRPGMYCWIDLQGKKIDRNQVVANYLL